MQHLLDIDSLSDRQVTDLLELAGRIAEDPGAFAGRLRGRILINLFFEPSTRTRLSFEVAAKRLGMDVVNFQSATSSTVKGETLLDTFDTVQAMRPDAIAIRHDVDGSVAQLAAQANAGVHVVNAGDGCHQHPTQALLDALTIQRAFGGFGGLTVAIAGDIAHSRVARSDVAILNALGAGEVRITGPRELLPPEGMPGARVCGELEEAVSGADVIVMLRIQKERFGPLALPDEHAYHEAWGLTPERMRLAAPRCIVLHPGPVNRGVEIASEVADGKHSLIRTQVGNGVFARMAALLTLVGQA